MAPAVWGILRQGFGSVSTDRLQTGQLLRVDDKTSEKAVWLPRWMVMLLSRRIRVILEA